MFSTLSTYLSFPFVQYALIVGILTSVSAALLGVPLVLKRVSFIGDGLSHVAFGAAAIATVLNMINNMYLVMPVTCLIAILLLGRGRNAKIKGDAALAMLSVGSLAFGYFVLNTFSVTTSNISGDVCASLFGSTSILTLRQSDLWLCVVMSIIVIVLYVLFYNKIFSITFDSAFMSATGENSRIYDIALAAVIGIVIALSMRLVGSLLTAALVVFPAISSMRVFKSFKAVVISSSIISVICAVLGMFISMIFATPVGATIVIADIAVFGIFYLFSILRK